jgi:hypothetical protein
VFNVSKYLPLLTLQVAPNTQKDRQRITMANHIFTSKQFQLYHGGQFYSRWKPEYTVKITDLAATHWKTALHKVASSTTGHEWDLSWQLKWCKLFSQWYTWKNWWRFSARQQSLTHSFLPRKEIVIAWHFDVVISAYRHFSCRNFY